MDYGAGYCDYRSDMTRTVVMGEPTQEQLDLYALVRRTHEECVAAIHPGVEGNDIFKLSKKIIGDAGYGDRYNHGLGHGVGIDIHELPNFNRSKNIIEVGSVITMEPGVYLPAWAACAWRTTASSPRTAMSLHQDPARPAYYRLLNHPLGFGGGASGSIRASRVLFLCARRSRRLQVYNFARM